MTSDTQVEIVLIGGPLDRKELKIPWATPSIQLPAPQEPVFDAGLTPPEFPKTVTYLRGLHTETDLADWARIPYRYAYG